MNHPPTDVDWTFELLSEYNPDRLQELRRLIEQRLQQLGTFLAERQRLIDTTERIAQLKAELAEKEEEAARLAARKEPPKR